MFTAYLDDSGTDPNQHAAIASAFVIPTQQVARLDRAWDNLKEKERFSSLHFAEMIAKNRKSEFADWNDEKQERVFQRVREISKKHSIAIGGISFSVNKADYDEVVPQEFRENLGNHYTWAVRHVITFLDKWRLPLHLGPLQYVFDWMGGPRDPRRTEVEEVIAQAEAMAHLHNRHGEYTNYSFRRREELPGLQCVDALGWVCYRQALLQYRGTPLHPLAKISWDDYGGELGSTGWLQALTVTRANLVKWVGLEMNDGRTLERFKQWKQSRTITS